MKPTRALKVRTARTQLNPEQRAVHLKDWQWWRGLSRPGARSIPLKNRRRYIRTTITVPADVKRQMKAHPGTS